MFLGTRVELARPYLEKMLVDETPQG